MTQFKTLQFTNDARGQAEKVRALQQATSQGWRVVSETIVAGKFRGQKACCLYLICKPLALTAGNSPDIITITLERDDETLSTDRYGENYIAPKFDRQKWNALLLYDSEIASAAKAISPLGSRWHDELAAGYMILSDNKYLPDIVESIRDRAKQEQTRREEQLAHQADLRIAEQAKRELEAAERKSRNDYYLNLFFGNYKRIIFTVSFSVGLIALLSILIGQLSAAAEKNPASVTTGLPESTATADLTAPPASPAQSGNGDTSMAEGPSFSCDHVKSAVLTLICVTPELSALDRKMAIAYSRAMLVTQFPEQLKLNQRNWNYERNNSISGVGYLDQLYNDRIAYLNSTAEAPAATINTASPRSFAPPQSATPPTQSPTTPSIVDTPTEAKILDCKNPTQDDCSNSTLKGQQLKIASIFRTLYAKGNPAEQFQFAQEHQTWKAELKACQTEGCLTASYQQRLRRVTAEAWSQYNIQRKLNPAE